MEQHLQSSIVQDFSTHPNVTKNIYDTQHTTHLPFIEKNYLNVITILPK